MKDKLQKILLVAIALAIFIGFAGVLTIYWQPMEDVSLDLSLVPQEDGMVLGPENFDGKGWTVFTQEGETRTELTPDGFGGYSGLELGQTFYLSRVLDQELDSPTLQLDAVEWCFAVWLDDDLIYADRPELDNRIGHLRLPTNGSFRNDPITVSLPGDYYGKTLTIAQSFPEWSETSRVTAYPTSVKLYCGYAYESGLISETFRTALLAMLALMVTLPLLFTFVRNKDWSVLCLALVAFLWMVELLRGTSFYYQYVSPFFNSASIAIPQVSTLALLAFLTLRGGKHRKWLWIPVGLYALSMIVYAVSLEISPHFTVRPAIVVFLTDFLVFWLAFVSLVAVLALGILWWRKENRFYRVFIPLAFVGIILSWAVECASRDEVVWKQIIGNLSSGQVLYLYSHTLPGIIGAALIAAVVEAVRTELDHRAEQKLLEQRKELTMASYESMRAQHEEVMKLRHDMASHYEAIRNMTADPKTAEYLDTLIGQSKKVRAIIHTGNQTLDIILNGKLSAAMDAGISVNVQRSFAPEKLDIEDAEYSGR